MLRCLLLYVHLEVNMSKKSPRYKTIWIKPQMVGKGTVVHKDNNLPNVKVVR